jgi:hypothetical protein
VRKLLVVALLLAAVALAVHFHCSGPALKHHVDDDSGGKTVAVKDWGSFLKRWSREWLATGASFPPSMRKDEWLGNAPATEEQIAALERRLGVTLPPSYKAFLRVSNGWGQTTRFIGSLRLAEEVDWLKSCFPDMIKAYSITSIQDSLKTCSPDLVEALGIEPPTEEAMSDEDYYSYTDETVGEFKEEHLAETLLVADSVPGDSAIYLLNPCAVTEDGEWEAWFMAHWVPGVERHPSYAHLMLHEYHSFRCLELNDESAPLDLRPYGGAASPDRPRRAADSVPQ